MSEFVYLFRLFFLQVRGNTQEQLAGVIGRKRVEVLFYQSGQGEMLSRGHQQKASGRRNKGRHLLGIAGVIHQEQCALSLQHRAIKSSNFL